MAAPTGRDPDVTSRALEAWLRRRLATEHVEVTDLRIPKAGYSNETILARAGWTDAGGTKHERPFVLRIEATGHQLFQEADALGQAAVMSGLAGKVPVPTIWLTDDDPSVLGAPFFLMDQVEGRIPPDLPTWHKRGWATELTPAQRTRLYDNALGGLVELHRVDWRDTLAFLESEGPGTALDRYLVHVQHWYDWCGDARTTGADVLAAAMDHVVANRPDDPSAQVSWGDARVGNMIFAEDLSVAAMLDWEGATIGPPGIDVGWWLMFEQYLSEAQGVTRLDGVPDRTGIIARYQQLGGAPVPAIDYYELLAGLVFALINSRLVQVLTAGGNIDPVFGATIITRITTMMQRFLDGPR
jgi:aminoglycoside phosphotransferase (APT) family kinase protein